MTKSLMPGLVYGCGCLVGTESFRPAVALNMGLIAVGVVVCALGEVNLVLLGLLEQLTALGFEVRRWGTEGGGHSSCRGCKGSINGWQIADMQQQLQQASSVVGVRNATVANRATASCCTEQLAGWSTTCRSCR
jgi:hypothetical protein